MSATNHPNPVGGTSRAHRRTWASTLVGLAALTAGLAACGIDGSVATGQAAQVGAPAHERHGPADDPVSTAMIATAAFQDVEVAEAAGYASSIDTLGCFQNPEQGGMGVHYIDEDLLDAELDVRHPEALVYELDADGAVVGLVAHEYIVPVDAWTSAQPPRLFGKALHRHPTLPLWVLHAWLWKPNADGIHADWNPAVRQCPAGVPIFGRDLPVG